LSSYLQALLLFIYAAPVFSAGPLFTDVTQAAGIAFINQSGGADKQYIVEIKSIIVNNLYGVDIMEEAVEICKLRLFLKLVAQLEHYEQIEPLPDIDFNVRAGNTLVGFTTLREIQDAFVSTPDGQRRMLYPEDAAKLKRIEEDAEIADRAQKLGAKYIVDLQKNSTMLVRNQRGIGQTETQSFKVQRSKPIIDEIDRVLAKHYGFTDAELDFIINYDIKYRMGLETTFETNTNDPLKLAATVCEGISDTDLNDMEEIIHDRRNFFGDRTHR